MDFQRLEASVRKTSGKGSSRKLRDGGRVPGIVYGRGADPIMIDLEPKALRQALMGPRRLNTVLNLVIKDSGEDAEMLVMLQDHQIHPRHRKLLHVDFLKVDLDRDVDVAVPLVATGRCQGVQMGGVLLQVYHKLPLRCRPADIPTEIVHDITTLGIGQSVKASELPLPAGVKVMLEADQAVLAVSAPQAEEKPAEAAAEGEEAAEEAEGEKKEGEEKKETEE
jgi:large subunit ribosomal protein L25